MDENIFSNPDLLVLTDELIESEIGDILFEIDLSDSSDINSKDKNTPFIC